MLQLQPIQARSASITNTKTPSNNSSSPTISPTFRPTFTTKAPSRTIRPTSPPSQSTVVDNKANTDHYNLDTTPTNNNDNGTYYIQYNDPTHTIFMLIISSSIQCILCTVVLNPNSCCQ